MKNIYVISVGPGDRKYLSIEALNTIEALDVGIGPERFMYIVKSKPYCIPKKIIEGTIELIKKNINSKVGVLVAGDAGFYSLTTHIIKYFGIDRVDIVPGINIVQLSFSKIGKLW